MKLQDVEMCGVRNNVIVMSFLGEENKLRVVYTEDYYDQGIGTGDLAYIPPVDDDNGNTVARRIVACWNLCRGVSTDELEERGRL